MACQALAHDRRPRAEAEAENFNAFSVFTMHDYAGAMRTA